MRCLAPLLVLFLCTCGRGQRESGVGKQNFYDHSVRVPLAIAGPGFTAKERIDADVYLQDAMPTSLELTLTDAAVSERVAFRSLLPVIQQ